MNGDNMQALVEKYEDDKEFPCGVCPMENDCRNEHTDKRIECRAVERYLEDREGGKWKR
jgi:hypothetical protein